jgi:hypothetical protein
MTAGGPNEYGDDSKKNRFVDPATGEAYFVIVNKKTGKTKIYNEEFGADKYIGEFDPETGKIKYNNNWWGGARKEEKAFFNDNKTLIKNQAKKVVTKEKVKEENLSAKEAEKEASKLLGEQNLEYLKTTSAEGTSELNEPLVGGRVYVYPASLRTRGNSQDTIQIRQIEYRASGLNQESLSGVNDRSKLSDEEKKLGATVILPIPGGIGSNNTTEWNSTTMNALDAARAQFLMKTSEAGAGEAINEVQKKFENANLGDLKTALVNAISSGAGQGNELLARTSGQIFNPNMEVLFKGPTIRDFSFNFQFAPRNDGEAKTVLQIIRFFKQGMAPIRTEGNLFLKTPHIFELKYTHKGGDHKGLNKFKECALTGCQIDYTPDANYSTFEDGVMTSYGMTLGFKELTPIYNDDYGKQVPAEIGF